MIYYNKQTVQAIFLAFFCLIITTSCVQTEEHSGYVRAPKINIDRIKIGVTDKRDIQYLLGSPSSKSTFGQETWYYISTKLANSAYEGSQIIDQNILIINFDDDGVVSDVIQKDSQKARKIDIATDITPTDGNKITVLEQLLGNLGRYNGSTQK